MKYILIIVFAAVTFPAFSQKEIQLDDLRNHIGDSVQLNGVIYGGKYLENVKGSPTFLNVGGNYPNALLTLVMWGAVRDQFWKHSPETSLVDKDCLIFGKLELYKDKPQIVIYSSKQIIEPAKVDVK